MKKIYILIVILILSLSLSSCKNKYEITNNAELLEYNKLGKYGFTFVNSDGDKEYFYKIPANVVVGAYDNTIKSKYTICYVYYDVNGNITNVVKRKTNILKKGQTHTLHLANGEKEEYIDGTYYRYIEWEEVLFVYENHNIYIDSSYFE